MTHPAAPADARSTESDCTLNNRIRPKDAGPTNPAACPVCSSADTHIEFRVSAREAAQHFVLREGNLARHTSLANHIAALWGKQECSLRRCAKCGFRFADPYVSGDQLFYNLAYERNGYPSDKWEYARTVAELKKIGIRSERVLEVGAGFGLFLDKIADIYVPKSGVTALDYADASVATLRSKGYTALQEDVRSSDVTGPFDAIFLFQVVEHLDRLDELFAKLYQLLRDDGILFVAVPNPRRIAFNEKNGSLLDMPPNHIGQWTPQAFEIIGNRHRLRLDAIETEPFSIGKFIKEDIVYAYLRRAQQAGTLENWSRRHRSSKIGKWLGAAAVMMSAPRRGAVWAKVVQSGDLGGSLWAKFTKSDAVGLNKN